jgi:nucleoside-diphosphate-sugar epimerase
VRYLLTGGAGFLGSALARRLLADGDEVIVLDDFSRPSVRLLPADCEIRHGDVRNPNTVTWAMRGCDRVVHLAYKQGTRVFYDEPRKVLDVAVHGMTAVLTACEATGCRDMLLVSSSEAYQVPPVVPAPETVPLTVPDVLNPRYSYGGGKILSELMAVAWARTGTLDRLIIVRPHNIIGPDMGREHVIPEFCLQMNRLVREYPDPAQVTTFGIQGTGEETRSFCWIGDCIDQLCLLLDKATPGQGIYHVGTMDERTISEVAHAVAACYGREIKVVPGTLQEGSPLRRLPDTFKIRALGYAPKVPFSEAVARTVRWYQDRG